MRYILRRVLGVAFIRRGRPLMTQPPRGAETLRKPFRVAYMQDPGSAGVSEAQATARTLDGYNVRFATASGDKETRAKPISAQCEAGNVKIIRGLSNDDFIRILENFPVAKHDDEVDGLSGAHGILAPMFSGGFASADGFSGVNEPLKDFFDQPLIEPDWIENLET